MSRPSALSGALLVLSTLAAFARASPEPRERHGFVHHAIDCGIFEIARRSGGAARSVFAGQQRANPERPRLRYLDGQLSINSSCMIRLGKRLNPGVPPAFINGAPVGFC